MVVVASHPWREFEHVVVLEARELLLAVRWCLVQDVCLGLQKWPLCCAPLDGVKLADEGSRFFFDPDYDASKCLLTRLAAMIPEEKRVVVSIPHCGNLVKHFDSCSGDAHVGALLRVYDSRTLASRDLRLEQSIS